MSLSDAIATQPLWVQYWLYVLLAGIIVLPLVLLIWKQTRLTAVIILVASFAAGFGVSLVYDRFGYVKLLGLPHIIFWLPLVWYLYSQIKREDMPVWPRRVMMLIVAVLMISLVFDVVDVTRFALGERAPLI
jgi:formate hydrogenlyase subunit 3/multisubunit Na+/H+ antiporter MnhD subunit